MEEDYLSASKTIQPLRVEKQYSTSTVATGSGELLK